MQFSTEKVKEIVTSTMPAWAREEAEEAFIDWLDRIVEDSYRQGSRSEQPDGYSIGFEDGYDEGYEQAQYDAREI